MQLVLENSTQPERMITKSSVRSSFEASPEVAIAACIVGIVIIKASSAVLVIVPIEHLGEEVFKIGWAVSMALAAGAIVFIVAVILLVFFFDVDGSKAIILLS
jgi:hypothetical protein